MTQIISTNTFGTTNFIVSLDRSQGSYTSIQDAVNAAPENTTIFICDGEYDEDVDFAQNVTLTAYTGDSSSDNVVITGSWGLSSGIVATVVISHIQFQSSAAPPSISLLGVQNNAFIFINCSFISSVGVSISYTNSNALSSMSFFNCRGNFTQPATYLIDMTSPGSLSIFDSVFFNDGLSIADNTITSANVNVYNSQFYLNFSFDSCSIDSAFSYFYNNSENINAFLSFIGTSDATFSFCRFLSSTSSNLNVTLPAQVNFNNCSITTDAANDVSGSGSSAFNSISSETSTSPSIATTTISSLNPTLFSKLSVITGTNTSCGVTSAMAGAPGSVTVNSIAINLGSVVLYNRNTSGGTLGNVSISSQGASSFTLTSDANETSTFNYLVIN